ncbi:hypothetical protein NKG05_08205 [Oerskovia sp. M15]
MAQTHAVHDLPGLALDPGDPQESASTAVGRYFGAYEQLNDLRVLRPVAVREVRDEPGSGPCSSRRRRPADPWRGGRGRS